MDEETADWLPERRGWHLPRYDPDPPFAEFLEGRDQPWNAWGHLYDMHGATGHGGSWWGYQGQMWFVEKEEGGYGIILLINTEFDFKAEARDLWLFASPLRLQVLLMEEAAAMHQQEMSE